MKTHHLCKISLSDSELKYLFEQFKNQNGDGLIGYNLPEEEVFKFRRSKVLCLNENNFSDLHEKIKNFSLEVAEDIFDEPDLFNLTLQITEYDESYEGFYDWHKDAFPGFDNDPLDKRVLSFSVLLNSSSEYEGGEFEFRDIDIDNFENTLDMIMFYSDLEHRVTPVTKGTRYSLVGWLSGVRRNNA